MPEINEVKKAYEIGLKGQYSMVWLPCAICGKEKWFALYYVRFKKNHNLEHAILCVDCSRKNKRRRDRTLVNIIGAELGTIVYGYQLGLTSASKYKYTQCPRCGLYRWAQILKNVPRRAHCHRCSMIIRPNNKFRFTGEKHPNYKTGKKVRFGYMQVLLTPDNPYYPMCNISHYVLEHRLVMAYKLGRCLERGELVHHINHNRLDNRIENLQLVPRYKHEQITVLENRIRTLESRVTLLECENILLRKEVGVNERNR